MAISFGTCSMNTGQAFMHAPQVVHAQIASGETLCSPPPISGQTVGASAAAEARLSDRPTRTCGPLASRFNFPAWMTCLGFNAFPV